MAATSVSVARMLQLRIPIAWQEAVELSRAAGHAAARAGMPLTIEGCVLSTEGTVHVTPAHGSGDRAPLTVPEFLGLVLEGQSAPPELKALVVSRGDPRPSSADDREGESVGPADLDWFASPSPELHIAGLATRAIAAAAEDEARAAIERLRGEVVEAPIESAPAPPERRGLPQEWRQALRIALAIVLLAAAGVTVRGLMARAPAQASEGEAAATLASPFIEALEVLRRVLASESTGVTRPEGVPAPADPHTAAGPLPAAPRTPPLPTPAAATLAWSPAAAAVAPTPAPAAGAFDDASDRSWPAAADPGDALSHAYSEQDEDVEPPSFHHPQLPSAPSGDSPHRESYMELTVDEHGQVLRVRLHSNDASLNDRMIIAAAKAWRFKPALKDGRPVPYVLRVLVTS